MVDLGKALSGAHCTACGLDFGDKCLVTVVPLLRITLRGELTEVPTPLVFTPMLCPNPECRKPMVRVQERPLVETPGLVIARRQ